MKTAVGWLLFELSKNGLLPDGIPDDIYEQAKEMEKSQRQEDFINGYKARAKLSGLIFDEASELTAKELFKQQSNESK